MATTEPQQQPKVNDKVILVRRELETLFSDANCVEKEEIKALLVDGAEGQINERKWVPISVLLNLAEVKQIEDVNADDIRGAVLRSRFLQLSEDGQQLRRQRYLDKTKRVHRFVVYVDRIPASADIDWLRLVFGRFGEVDVVSLLHFQDSKIKTGCAYIEFADEESARKASKYYRNLYLRQVQEDTFNKNWEDTTIDKASLSENDVKTMEIRQQQRRLLVNKLSRTPRSPRVYENKEGENGVNGTEDAETGEKQVNGAVNEVIEVDAMSAENEKLAEDLIVVSLAFYLTIKQNVQFQMRRKQRDTRFQRRSKIIRIHLNEATAETPIPKVRSTIRNMDRNRTISFIDVPVVEDDQTFCYVRCKFPNRAGGLAERFAKLGEATILNDEDEESYNTRVKKLMDEKRAKREESGEKHHANDSSAAENADSESGKGRSFPKGVLLKVEAEFEHNAEENVARQFKGKLYSMPVRRGIAFVDVPREEQSEDPTHKVCFVRFRLARYATDFMEQPDVKTLGEITLLDGEEEQQYWEKNIFRGRDSLGPRPNRRNYNKRERPSGSGSGSGFKNRSFRPRTNNFKPRGGNRDGGHSNNVPSVVTSN